jgi:uncharacterized coiled-coil protein SlyX
MRTNLVLLMLIALALSAGGAWAQGAGAAASSQPTVGELQRQVAEITTKMAEMQVEMERLLDRIEELEVRPAEAEALALPSDDLAALRAAARVETAGEEPIAEEAEQPTFTSGALGLQALNPEISVTGDFISSYRSGSEVDSPFENSFRNLGLHLESYLDPYSRFKSAVEVHTDEVELGEAYFTRYGLLPNMNLTLGKFRQQFGVVNRWHKHGLDQVDFPLPLRQIFGPGGLNQIGFSGEVQLPPLGEAAQELTLEVTNGENGSVFGQNSRNMPAVLAHYKNYRDLSKDAYLEVGLTGLGGRNDTWPVLGPGDEIMAQRRDLWTTVLGADLTLLWEPTGEMRYKNWVWRTEAYWLNKDILAPDDSGRDTLRAWGAYSYYQRKLNRTLDAGIRVDYYEPDVKPYADLPGLSLAPLAVAEPGAHQWLFAPYLTWYQSPWVHWRLELNHLDNHGMGPDEDALYLQCIFAAGPHKHERY